MPAENINSDRNRLLLTPLTGRMKASFLLCMLLIMLASCSNKLSSKQFTFKAEKTRILKGETIALRWQCHKADDVRIDGFSDHLPPTGSVSVTPDTTTVYKLTAERRRKEVFMRKLIVIVQEPTFTYLQFQDSLTDEKPVTCRWKAINAEKVRIDGLPEEFPAEGSASFHLDSSVSMKFTAINKYGKSTEKIVEVTLSIREGCSADPDRIVEGDSAKIYWSYKNTRFVMLEGHTKKYPAVDSVTVFPEGDSIFNITATRRNGSQRTDTVRVTVDQKGIAVFKGTARILIGNTAVIRWVTYGAEQVILEGDGPAREVKASGSVSVKPERNTMYKLKAVVDGITHIREFEVLVIQRSFVDSIIPIKNLKSGQRMDFEIFEVDRSNYPDEVRLKVLVVDTAGNFISGLAPKAKSNENKYFRKLIEIVERKSIPVRDFKVREINDSIRTPKDITLVLDYSGSMSGSIGKLTRSVARFIQRKDTADRLSLIVFDDSIAMLTPLSKDLTTVLRTYKGVSYSRFGHSTSLYAASDKALNIFDGSSRQKLLLLFTDGYENSSFLHGDSLLYSVQGIVEKARRKGVRFHVIAFGRSVNTPLLEYLSVLTDGNMYKLLNNDDIDDIYREFSIISKHYYEIVYKPAPLEGNHEVRLTFFNQQETMVAKKNFFIGDKYYISDWSVGDTRYVYLDSIIQAVSNADHTSAGNRRRSPLSVPQSIAQFEFNSSDLRSGDLPMLDQYIIWLKKNEGAMIILLGHTDLKGGDKSCELLSQKRADAVMDYFITSGITNDRIRTAACGKRFPLNTEESDEIKAAENRRVEIVILM